MADSDRMTGPGHGVVSVQDRRKTIQKKKIGHLKILGTALAYL
jgi:hypothetical protein